MISAIPKEALLFKAPPPTRIEILQTAERMRIQPVDMTKLMSPRTGRRYIVVGGAGFVGGWIVRHLLERGEDPKSIRILDIKPPIREDVAADVASGVDLHLVDISNAELVTKAFMAPWPGGTTEDQDPELTIFHSAASIRFYERAASLIPLSWRVNVGGTQNVIEAAKRAGAAALIFTSSGSISITKSRFSLWPWETEPVGFVQPIDDDDNKVPKTHTDFFSNYAYTKFLAETLVRDADKSTTAHPGTLLRTGCIRPGNGIFGPGGDVSCAYYLTRKFNVSWVPTIVQNFAYVENVSIAHLCYERRLIDGSSTGPDIGGQAFCITDPGAPLTYGDIYSVLNVLTNGATNFTLLSPTLMLFLSHVVEAWYLFKHYTRGLPFPFSIFHSILPSPTGDLVNLQPSLFSLVNIHLNFDDSRARRSPKDGGLGYQGAWTTLEALCKVVDEHKKNKRIVPPRQIAEHHSY